MRPSAWAHRLVAGALAILAIAPAFAQSKRVLEDAAFRAAQSIVNAEVAEAISIAALRESRKGQQSGRLIEARWTLTERLAALREERAVPDPAAGQDDNALRRANLLDEENRLLAELVALDAELARDDPEFAMLVRPGTLGLSELQALLRVDEALVLVAPGAAATHIFAVTRDQVEWRRSETTATQIRERVYRLRLSLGAGVNVRGRSLPVAGAPGTNDVFDAALARQLYNDVFAPVAEAVAEREIIYIARAGALRQLPMSILVADTTAAGEVSFLIDRHAIAELPSVASLGVLRSRPSAGHGRNGRDFVGVGAPRLVAFNGQAVPGLADPRALGALSELPGAGQELRQIARSAGENRSVLLIGEEASEGMVRGARRADIEGARVLIFATHALQADEPGARSVGEPGLVLSTPQEAPSAANDGFLSASEIAALRLSADLVVLSACSTAGSVGEMESDGVGVLSQAFFAAGAKAVLASHWAVEDRATATLISSVLAPQGVSTLRGFRAAVTQLRRSGELTDPRQWGAFTFVGVEP